MKLFACPTGIGLSDDKEFQKLKELYVNENFPEDALLVYLQLYREDNDKDLDWLPSSDDDYKDFTNYINAQDPERKSKITKEYVDSLYKVITTLYTPSMLNNRLNRIATLFSNYVDNCVARSTFGTSRQEVIKANAKGNKNGFNIILEKVFDYIESLSTIDGQKTWYKKQHPNVQEIDAETMKFLEHRAEEFAKMNNNKEALFTLAAMRIGEREGFSVNIDGLEYNFSEKEQIEDTEDTTGDDTGKDDVEATKGDRYDDYRTLPLSSTLSTEARKILDSINLIDRNGNIIRDDLGYPVTIDTRRAVVSLHNILRTSTPKTMKADLEKATGRYPWVRSLINYLRRNPQDERYVYCTFKKSKNLYYYGYKNSKTNQLEVRPVNNVADGKGLSREAGMYLINGTNAEETLSIVNTAGELESKERITELSNAIDEVNKFRNTYLEARPESKDGKVKWAVEDAAKDWQDRVNARPVSDFDTLTSILRGIGFNLSAEDVKYAVANAAPIADYVKTQKNGSKVTYNKGSLLDLVTNLKEIARKADYILDEGEDASGSHLYNYAQGEFAKIADILSAVQETEVEDRAISGKKSLAASTAPNALHELSDTLSNIAGISDEEYKKMLWNQFGQYEGMSLGFTEDSLTGWLADLYNASREVRRQYGVVDFTDFTDIVKKDYAKLTDAEHALVSFVMYARGNGKKSDFRMYEVPIQADYETAYNFFRAKEYSRDELVERLAQEVECEAQRINAIRERQKNDPEGEPIRAIDKTYEKNGLSFQIFPELNSNSFVADVKAAQNAIDRHEEVKRHVSEQLDKMLEATKTELNELGFYKRDIQKLAGKKGETNKKDMDKTIDSWILNSFYARQQMVKILYGGLEHFKNVADFEKRSMYAHATRLPLYTNATYVNGKGEKEIFDKENQNVIYIGDDEVRSEYYKQISDIADKLQAQGKITSKQVKQMKKAYESIKTTDGQGIRTLDSMRAVKIMASTWTTEDEDAYLHIKDGDYTPAHVNRFLTGIKPVYTGYEIIPAQPGGKQKPVRIPVLHKYSEMILLPEMENAVLGAQNDSAPFKALNKINDALPEHQKIDLFLFGSDVKIGAHSVIGMFNKDEDGNRILRSADEMADFVSGKIKQNGFYVHALPYKYLGLASSIHDNVEDDNIAWATQAQKEVWGNIFPDEEIDVNDNKMKAVDARDLFYKIAAARTVYTFNRVNKRFANENEIATLLKTELASKSYQPRDLVYALQRRDSGKFVYPLYSPNIQHDVISLLSSAIKKAFTKVPTRGANMTQVTSLGLDKEMENRSFTGSLPNGFSGLEVKFDKDGNFKYVEAYISIHDSNLEQFADENGNITPKRLSQLVSDGYIPESALNFIAYRTPSDAEHSVIPCRIKGFLNKTSGPYIRLPREIMKMTGHDYDGDKMRCHFKSLYSGWNYKQINKDYKEFSNTEAMQVILGQSNEATLTPYDVFVRNATSETNPDSSKYRAVREARYDYGKDKTPFDSIGKNGDFSALNNAMVDLMFAQLTSENGGLKMFIPGGCEETLEYANEIGSRMSSVTTSPFTVSHATQAHGYMMEGAGMIGVYALYNSANSMFQRLNLSYLPKKDKSGDEVQVKIFDKTVGDLFPITTGKKDNKSFTTLGMSRLLNAAVDNGKEPLLGYLNQTEQLSHLTNFLFAAGLEEEEIHLLFNQPVMKELAKRLKSSNADNLPLVGNDMMQEMYEALYGKKEKRTSSQADNVRGFAGVSKASLYNNLGKNYSDMLQTRVFENQILLLDTMLHINPAARDLEQFVKLTRPEADRGGIDSTLGGTQARLIQLENFREKIQSGDIGINGMWDVLKPRNVYENTMKDSMILDEFGNKLPEVVALNTLMKDSIMKIFSKNFPQARESWQNVAKKIADLYSYTRIPASVVERIHSDMILWKLLSNKSFVGGDLQAEQNRVVREVPEQLRTLKRRISNAVKNSGTDVIAERLNDNIFLNNLDLGATINDQNETIGRIRFRMNGSSIEDTADSIRADWSQLVYSEDKEIRQLGFDLFKYNLFTNGFAYGRYEFAHFAPVSVILETPGYLSALNAVLDTNWGEEETAQFVAQYQMNHWGDKNLIKRFTPDVLPVELRDKVGFKANAKPVNFDTFCASLQNDQFILVHTVSGNKQIDTMYELVKDELGYVRDLVKVNKLGIRNKGGQSIVYYNPSIGIDYHSIAPTFTTNEVAWEGRNLDENEDKDAGKVSEYDRNAAIDAEDYQFPVEVPVKTVKALDDTAKEAGKHNSGILSAEDAAKLGLDDSYFNIVERDENGDVSLKQYAATPEIIDKARAQEAFVKLNAELRKILADKGVRIGVLEEAESRLMAGGVSDFSAARVLAEGMAELIRLSKDETSAMYALPEEFAHVAIEMLGEHHAQKDADGNILGFNCDNKLVERLLNELNRNQTALEEAYAGKYDLYSKHYNDNREKLIVEAAGKLVAKHLFLHQYAKTPSTRSLVSRLVSAIKDFFKNWDWKKLYNAIFKSESIASQLAKDLLSGKLADEMSLDKITSKEKFLQLDKDLTNKSDILSKIVQTTTKQLQILSRRLKFSMNKGATSSSVETTKRQLSKLEAQAENQKLELTVVDYLKDASKFMKDAEASLDATINNRPANSVCRKLRVVKDTLFGYASVLKDIRDAIADGELKDKEGLKNMLTATEAQIADFWTKYDRISMMYFEKFLESVYGKDGVTVKFGRDKGRVITIQEMARRSDHDVNFASRWLDAMSDADDYVLQAIDNVTRDAKLDAREKVNKLRPKLEAAMSALIKEQGNRDQSWMYERRKVNGKLVRTGRYISQEQADKLSDAKREFYNTFMELKGLADACCPDSFVSKRKMIMLRKEHYEKLKEAQNAKGFVGEEWDNVKRGFLEMNDIDTKDERLIDFEHNIVDQLPLKFLNKGKEESFDDMTEDAATSLMAYLGMAYEYHELNSVIGLIENARYMSSKRDIEKKKLSISVGKEGEFHFTEPYTVKQARTNIQGMMNDFITMHVYGHLSKDEGTFGNSKISKRKVVNKLVGYTSLSQMALNIHQRIANVNTGLTQILVETAGKEIKVKDITWASGIWMKESADRLAETGKTDYDNKLSLWMDKFDIHQDNGRETSVTKYGRSNVSRAFNSHLLYAGLTVGEDFLAGTTALAYARNFKLKGPDGKESNLWDAYEVKYTNPEKKTGAYLQLKDGYTKADGTALTAEDERKFQKKVIATNFALQGIYNVDDRSAIQQHSLGALAIMYRKWIAPALKRRYSGVRYSKLRDDYTEGYYITAFREAKETFSDWLNPVSEDKSKRTILQILTNLRAFRSTVLLNWEKMTPYEQGNCRRACRELGITFVLIISSMLLAKLPPDDHDGNNFLCWADNFAMSQLFRLRSEISSQAPTPNLVNEASRILSSPFAALRPIKDTVDGLNLLWLPNYSEEIKSGRYKGKKKAYKYFINLPIISMFKKVDNFRDPSDMINYYKNQLY